MKQLTIRGFDDELERRLRQLAKAEGISLNQAALRLLRRGSGLVAPNPEANLVDDSLDHLIGTWSDAESDEFTRAVDDFERIDDGLWK